MKKLLSIIVFVILIFGCTKSKNDSNPQAYTHLTSAQILDSIGFKYEKKYAVCLPTQFPYATDTLIFHSDNTITEIIFHDTVHFGASFRTLDTAIHYSADIAGKYYRYLYIIYNSKIDTISYRTTNTFTFRFIDDLLAGKMSIQKNDTTWAAGSSLIH